MIDSRNPGRVRRVVNYGGGAVVAGVGALAAIMAAEAAWARRVIGPRRRSAPYDDGLYGPRRTGTSLRYVMLGDSSAAGFGVDSPLETPGALIAQGIVDSADRPVRFVNVSTVGAKSADLDQQVSRALLIRPHVATVMIGANDVTHLKPLMPAAAAQGRAIRRLVEAGTKVVVGTCPDMGSIGPFRQPLRGLAGYLSRRMAALQTVEVVEAGARSVSLGDLLGPVFSAQRDVMFGADLFHPSSAGYAAAAQVLLPSVLDALGLAPKSEQVAARGVGTDILPVVRAAEVATDEAGMEVVGTRVEGDAWGPEGRWVRIRHRRVHELSEAEPPVLLPVPEASDTSAMAPASGAD